jgi:hypothetical protein
MATADIRDQLYPFSTEDNKSIPLDIIRPLGLIRTALASAVLSTIVIPATWKLASFFCPAGCYIQFFNETLPSPLIDGTEYVDTLFVPPSCVVTSTVIAGNAKILMLGTGTSYLAAQNIQKWAGLSLNRKLTTI